jgi:hypothetical protein
MVTYPYYKYDNISWFGLNYIDISDEVLAKGVDEDSDIS